MKSKKNNSKNKDVLKQAVNIKYGKNQFYLIHEVEARFKVVAKGRRFGLTRGMMHYAIQRAIEEEGEKIFWVDTTYANIQRYIERYALPILKTLPKGLYEWNKTKSEIKVHANGTSIIDFRSADRPENFEGFGYDLVLLNEAGIILRNENLWLESIRPMMLEYKADAIIGGTPKGKKYKGKEHLFYKLFNKENRGDGKAQRNLFPEEIDNTKSWKSFNFTSYDNEMLEKEEVDEFASEVSPTLRDQEIFGLFVDADTDRIIKREWFDVTSNRKWEENRKDGQAVSRADPSGIKEAKAFHGARVIQSWDTAFKRNEENDYSVCTTWVVTKNSYYLADIYRDRLEFPELKRKVIELNKKFNPHEIIIEDKASGISLIQELQRETVLPIKAIKVSSDKVARVHSITPIIEAGNVVLYSHMEFDLNLFLDECEDFPNGEFDDMVDSMSQALEHLRIAVKVEAPKPIVKKYRKKKIY